MILQVAMVGVMLFPQMQGSPPLQDPWMSPDKAKHFLIVGFVESVSFAGLEAAGVRRSRAFQGAVTVTAAVSVLRELHDKRVKKQFSYRDLAWDMAGGVAAFVMLRNTQRP